MRVLLHLGLFAFALVAVSQASADHDERNDKRLRDRHTNVVIAPEPPRQGVTPVRAPSSPPYGHGYYGRYDRYGGYDGYDGYDGRGQHGRRGFIEARQDLYDQRRDHDQIARLVHRWEEASAWGNPHAQRKIERRIDAWIEREIEESSRRPGNGRYVLRLHEMRRQLWTSHLWHPRGHGRRHRAAHTARILDELVMLSENQLRRARARVRSHQPVTFAYR